jgi:CRISPR associated protein.
MIQCTLDPKAFMAFAHEQGLDPARGELDLGYLGHAWLKAAFGNLAPRPWRLFMPKRSKARQPSRILAYSHYSHDALADHMARFTTPAVAAVCPPEAVLSKAMPQDWPTDQRYAFESVCCPVGRKAQTGREKDLFLIEADHAPEGRLNRAHIYQHWFKTQAESVDGIQIANVILAGFRLAGISRKAHETPRKSRSLRRPYAEFRGVLQAADGTSLLSLLQRGIGRHRAFGFGMVLIRLHR